MADDRHTKNREKEILNSLKERYKNVSTSPVGHFKYPVGRMSALGLGYKPEWLETVPEAVVDRFVGVGNPFIIEEPCEGQSVLDVGCGCGFDTFVASILTGPEGRSVGVDMSPDMLAVLSEALKGWKPANLEFHKSSIEELPFDDNSFDLVVSNGVINLVWDKDSALKEIYRVLKSGGIFAAADLLVIETIPEEVLADKDAWST